MVDFRINLAKSLTSTYEQRQRFYNGMLIYFITCAVVLVFVAYLSSFNVKWFLDARAERNHILSMATAVSSLDIGSFKNPDIAYDELSEHSEHIITLKDALQERVQLLPIIHNLMLDLPDGVVLQSLAANKSLMTFDLSMPPPSEEEGDPVRNLTQAWEKNEVLRNTVTSIRPVKGERRTIGGRSLFYYKFQCVLRE